MGDEKLPKSPMEDSELTATNAANIKDFQSITVSKM
jgi:hypothetical protein